MPTVFFGLFFGLHGVFTIDRAAAEVGPAALPETALPETALPETTIVGVGMVVTYETDQGYAIVLSNPVQLNVRSLTAVSQSLKETGGSPALSNPKPKLSSLLYKKSTFVGENQKY